MTAELTRAETWGLLALSGVSFSIIAATFQNNGDPLYASLAFSGLAFAATFGVVRWAGPAFIKAGRKGRDMSKLGQKEIPETMGLVAAGVCLLIQLLFMLVCFYEDLAAAVPGFADGHAAIRTSGADGGVTSHQFPVSKELASYLSAIATLSFTVNLGFLDDVFDLRWRHKFFLPAIGALPLLVVYSLTYGVTHVVVPHFLVAFMPNRARLVDLSYLYYLYMAALSIFAPNSINILAGINGIEVGQSLVIGVLLVLNSSLYLIPFPGNPVLNNGFVNHPHPATDYHLLCLYLLLPFLGVSAALFSQNRYPAKVFVGDTYCYFAGMTFACVAILAHFSKTLLLLLMPQIFNFIYSAPQLLHIVPCPRHRLPKFNARTGLLEPSVTVWPRERPPSTLLTAIFTIMAKFRVLQITTHPDTNRIATTSNLTILNLWLVWFGPIREDALARQLLGMQMACGLAGLLIRHTMALWIFSIDNRGSGMV